METKNWWESKTIWSALVAVAAGLLNVFGKQIDPALQGTIADWLTQGVSIVGAAVAAWGRTQATATIGKKDA